MSAGGVLFIVSFSCFAALFPAWSLEPSVFGGDKMSIEVPATSSPVDVVVEQSSDLVNWTAVTPGTFNGSTQKRFFRLRAVEK